MITKVNIDTTTDGPVINKNIYGHFAEHLGRCIYDGLWVGPESEIPNTKGWRNDVVAALKELHVPVIRWPGGCFADEYHWRNGIGPREERPVLVNTLWGGVPENNAVGTHEFFDLIDLLGAEAYINGNLGTGTPHEMAEWLQYMTFDAESDLAEERRRNGRDKPFPVAHFGVGNESWGCGGSMEPAYYVSLFKHWGTFLRTPWDVRPKFVGSGGHGADPIDWTRWADYLTANIKPTILLGFDAVNFHYYTHPIGDVYNSKGPATGFPEEQWHSTIVNTVKMDGLIAANKAAMDKNDPEKRVSLYIDEWGIWCDPEPGTVPAFLFQQSSLRDGVVTALNFNIFHKHADRVRMTNIAQIVNVVQSLILTEGDKMVLTPTYHAYKMYVPFQEATTLPLTVESSLQVQYGDDATPAISASAARGKDGKLYLALVNAHLHQAETVSVNVVGMTVSAVNGEMLTANAMDAHNTFDAPRTLEPVAYSAKANNGALTLEIPAKSVVVVAVE